MDDQRKVSIATLAVAVVTLGLVASLALRPSSGAGADVPSVRSEVAALRGDIERLHTLIESSSTAPADLSAIERRLDGLDGRITTLSASIDQMNSTAQTICQMVADSPFTPAETC